MKKFLKLNAEKKLAEYYIYDLVPFQFFFILNEGKKETGEPGNSNCFRGRGLD